MAWSSTSRALALWIDGLGADVILLDPGEPASGQRRDVGADQGLQADVARLGQEHRAEAQVEVVDPGIALADVAEFAGELGPGQDFQEDLGQVHPGQPRGHVPAEIDQADGLVQLVQRGERQDVASARPLDRHGGVGRQVFRGPPVGFVELLAEPLQFRSRRGRPPQGPADARPDLLPGWPSQELGVRVSPASAGGHEQVAASEAVLEPFQDAERVEVAVDPAFRGR